MPEAESLFHIAEPLRPLAVRVADLHLDPKNARHHTQRSLQGIIAALRQFGQQKPIVVRKETMTVIAGNGTLEAARMLEWEWIAAAVVDMTEKEAAAYAISDNRTAELSQWEEEILKSTLTALTGAENDGSIDPLSLGFTDKEFGDLFGGSKGKKGKGEEDSFQHVGVSQRLGESYDYIVLLFKSAETFTAACDLLGVERVIEKPYVPAKKPKIGIGRVIDGATALGRIAGGHVPQPGSVNIEPPDRPVGEGAGPAVAGG